jgi:hypothetical protein
MFQGINAEKRRRAREIERSAVKGHKPQMCKFLCSPKQSPRDRTPHYDHLEEFVPVSVS